MTLFLVLGLCNCEAAATKFTNLKCESLDANWVVFTQCRLKLIRRGVVSLNIYATVLKPATNIKVSYKKRKSL